MKQLLLKSSGQRISLYEQAVCRFSYGVVYTFIEDSASYVLLYHPKQLDLKRVKKLISMVDNQPTFALQNQQDSPQLLWPTDLVVDDDGNYHGFTFKKINFTEFMPLSTFITPAGAKIKAVKITYKSQLLLAYHFSALLSNLHQREMHLVNFDPARILVHKHSLKPLIVDSDQLSIVGNKKIRFPAYQCNWRYRSPEAIKLMLPAHKLGISQDNYALAVLVFQLLNFGLHPYQGRTTRVYKLASRLKKLIREQIFVYQIDNPYDSFRPLSWSIHSYFDNETNELFRRAFSSGNEIPSASEWQLHLKKYISASSSALRQCKHNAEHYHFLKGCALCAIKTKANPLIDRLLQIKNKIYWFKVRHRHSPVKMYEKL